MVDQTRRAELRKILFFLESYLLPILFFAQAIYACLNFINMEYFSILSLLNDILRPLTFAIVLFYSSRNVTKHFDPKIALGLGLSYIPFFFLKFSPTLNDTTFEIGAFSLNVFYLIILFSAVFQIRSHFTVLPGFKKLTSNGLYSIVRHPIYSTYLHLAFIFLLISPTVLNSFLISSIFIGLHLRAQSEEKVISNNEENYLKVMPKTRFFHWILTAPIIILLGYKLSIEFKRQKNLIVNIAYPIYSLIPYQADDWSSFFVMNHIYPRFNSRVGIYRSNSIFDKKEVTCKEAGIAPFSVDCKNVQVTFQIKKNLRLCNGQNYNSEDFQTELSLITSAKNWIFPGYKSCGENCFEFQNVKNIQDHFDSIYLRFGWSKNKSSDKSIGISPHCFEPEKYNGATILKGTLITPKAKIQITHADEESDVVLYGNKSNDSSFTTLNYYNPIYFYLVSKYAFEKSELKAIQDMFLSSKIISSKVEIDIEARKRNKLKLSIKIPDYLDNCKSLEEILSREIKTLSFECTNISVFTENIVKKNKAWESFISPLTPGMPGKNGIDDQYFNPNSNDNWLGANPRKTAVVLLGVTSGSIQVKKGKFCSITPNSLGLSDITIDDFVPCE